MSKYSYEITFPDGKVINLNTDTHHSAFSKVEDWLNHHKSTIDTVYKTTDIVIKLATILQKR
jgi:hypothetical protein